MKNLKKLTLLAMLSFYAAAFAEDGNIFKKTESDNNTTYQLEMEDEAASAKALDGGGLEAGDDPLPPAPIDGYVLALAGAALGIIVLYRRKIVLSDNKL